MDRMTQPVKISLHNVCLSSGGSFVKSEKVSQLGLRKSVLQARGTEKEIWMFTRQEKS